MHNSGVRPRHTDRRVRKAGQWRARRRASKPLGQRSASESVKRRSSDSGQRSPRTGCREALQTGIVEYRARQRPGQTFFFLNFFYFIKGYKHWTGHRLANQQNAGPVTVGKRAREPVRAAKLRSPRHSNRSSQAPRVLRR